jgi:uncharacterized protein YdhG (YjbR/CyaY superfamily)
MNMFKPVNAKSVDEYIDMLEPDRKKAIEFLHSFIQKASPSLNPHFAYNMLGYGSFKVRNYKKEMIDWPTVALASQKNYISLYICAVDGGEYMAEKNKDKLGKVSVGKSCIRFKKIDDLNLKELEKLIKKAAASPGLVMAKQ